MFIDSIALEFYGTPSEYDEIASITLKSWGTIFNVCSNKLIGSLVKDHSNSKWSSKYGVLCFHTIRSFLLAIMQSRSNDIGDVSSVCASALYFIWILSWARLTF